MIGSKKSCLRIVFSFWASGRRLWALFDQHLSSSSWHYENYDQTPPNVSAEFEEFDWSVHTPTPLRQPVEFGQDFHNPMRSLKDYDQKVPNV